MNITEINAKLKQLEEIKTALLGEVPQGAQERIRALEAAQPVVKPKTKAMEALLMAGYGMNIETAKRIIAERNKDPHTWPLERYEQAEAMLAAYEAKPEVVSKRQAWQRAGR